MHQLTRGSSARSLTGWLVGFCASGLADQVFFLSLTWAALEVGTPDEVGWVLAAGSIPRLLILLVGGAFADKASPKRIIIGTDSGRALVMAGAAALLMVGSLTSWQLVVVALAIGALDGFFLPAMGALPARIAPPHLMGRVAAMRTVTQRAAILVGGPLAGWVIYLAGASAAFWVSAGLFAVSVGSLALVSVGAPARDDVRVRSTRARQLETVPPGSTVRADLPVERPEPAIARDVEAPRVVGSSRGVLRAGLAFLADVRGGVRAVRKNPVVPWLLLLIAGMNLGFAGPVTAGLPLLSASNHWGSQGAGLLLGGFGLGATATGLTLVFVRWLPRAGWVAFAGVGTMGLALTSLSLVSTFALAMVSTIVLGLASGVFGTVVHAMVLTSTPEPELGRVMSLLSLSIEGVVPVSFALTGASATALGEPWAFALGGALIVLVTLAAFTRPQLRHFELAKPTAGGQAEPSERLA